MNQKIKFEEISVYLSAEESPGFLLWRASTLWRRAIEAVLKSVELTHPQFVILASIAWLTREGNKASQTDISKHVALDPNTTSQILRGLQAKGLVERAHLTDERSKHPTLTAEGAKRLKKAFPMVEGADIAFFDSIGSQKPAMLKILRVLAKKEQP